LGAKLAIRRRKFIQLAGAAMLGFPHQGMAQTRADLPLVGILFPGTPEAAKGCKSQF
jgi:hypothetical protein